MLLKKLIEIRRADAELPPEIRAALVKSLFAPISSLTVGAINCSIIGMVVALSVGNDAIMANSVAIFAVGMLRVVSAILYRRYRAADQPSLTKTWDTPPLTGSLRAPRTPRCRLRFRRVSVHAP